MQKHSEHCRGYKGYECTCPEYTPEELVFQLIDMADCAQGWISEDNDHPDAIPDSWADAIRAAAKAFKFDGDIENLLPKAYKDVTQDEPNTIDDGFGNAWSKTCPTCGKDTMQIVRPGKVQCSHCG